MDPGGYLKLIKLKKNTDIGQCNKKSLNKCLNPLVFIELHYLIFCMKFWKILRNMKRGGGG